MEHNNKWKSVQDRIRAYLNLCDFSMRLYIAGAEIREGKKISAEKTIERILRKIHNKNQAAKIKMLKRLGKLYDF